jgi:hypothetical protein
MIWSLLKERSILFYLMKFSLQKSTSKSINLCWVSYKKIWTSKLENFPKPYSKAEAQMLADDAAKEDEEEEDVVLTDDDEK